MYRTVTSPILGGTANEKLFRPCADLCKGAETAESDDHSVCHYFDISGDSNFSVADMMIRTQSDRMTGKNGSWHIELDGISQETALKIAERDDVVSIGAVTIFNPDGELPYRMDGKRVVLYGIDESYLTMNSTGAAEGRFPQGMGEIMLSSNAARVLQVAVGGHCYTTYAVRRLGFYSVRFGRCGGKLLFRAIFFDGCLPAAHSICSADGAEQRP